MAQGIFGCIEAGGTKFVLGVARSPDEVLRTARVPTTSPQATLEAAAQFFMAARDDFGAFDAFGIGSFGPVDLDPHSVTWGSIVATPKPGWTGTDLARRFGALFDCPVGFDTDVNAAALAESLWGASVGVGVSTYVTVGTGIGGGVMVEGRAIHGLRHPEMGHFRPERHKLDQEFVGTCPFHGACLEGLASGPAIMARWGASLSDLPADHDAHDIVALYLAQLAVAQQALLSPHRMVFGGGVLATPNLIERIRVHAAKLAAGYFGPSTADYDQIIVTPRLGDRAGLLGALALAQAAAIRP